MPSNKYPIHRKEDNELLGYIAQDVTGWQAQTIFGYGIARTQTRKAAEQVLYDRGLQFLTGVWQYFDKDDQDWHSCVLKEAYEHKVTVIRTNVLGYQDPDDYKQVTIENPSETNLIKA